MKHKDLAKQAGFHISSSNNYDIGWVWCSDEYPIDEQLERFAELVRQDEREAMRVLLADQARSYQQANDFGSFLALSTLDMTVKARGEK